MKLSLSLVSCLALVAGCKTDAPEPAAGTAASQPGEQTSLHKPRSGKIDVERPRQRDRGDQAGSADTPAEDDRPRDNFADRRARFEERRAERMKELDANGDGTVSPEEMAAAREKRAADMKTRFDTDGDGKLTVSELGQTRMFRRGGDPTKLDVDKNGEISQDELKAGIDQMRGRFRGGPRGDGGDDGSDGARGWGGSAGSGAPGTGEP